MTVLSACPGEGTRTASPAEDVGAWGRGWGVPWDLGGEWAGGGVTSPGKTVPASARVASLRDAPVRPDVSRGVNGALP